MKTEKVDTAEGIPQELVVGSRPAVVSRSLFGGALMGLANLVPGISGGTMLLAAGIYPGFIEAIAGVTRFRFRFRALMILSCVVLAGGVAILAGAGVFKDLVVERTIVGGRTVHRRTE